MANVLFSSTVIYSCSTLPYYGLNICALSLYL